MLKGLAFVGRHCEQVRDLALWKRMKKDLKVVREKGTNAGKGGGTGDRIHRTLVQMICEHG